MASAPTTATYEASHNDWWHRDTSNFGQWFVGRVNFGAAAYDSRYTEISEWMPRSPHEGGSVEHIAFNAEQGAAAKRLAAELNARAAA